MRKLFVPACVCLMTWSGATGSDPKLSLDEFYGNTSRNKDLVAQAAPPEAAAAPAQIDIPQIDIPTDAEASDAAIDVIAPQPQSTAIDPDHIPLPPIAKPVVERSHQEICDTLTQAAQSNNVPVPFFISLLFQESRFKAGVVSSAGAQGIAQFMPETATSMGLENPFDPLQAIPASARLLRESDRAIRQSRSRRRRLQCRAQTHPGLAGEEGQVAGRNPGLRQDHHRPPGGNLDRSFGGLSRQAGAAPRAVPGSRGDLRCGGNPAAGAVAAPPRRESRRRS